MNLSSASLFPLHLSLSSCPLSPSISITRSQPMPFFLPFVSLRISLSLSLSPSPSLPLSFHRMSRVGRKRTGSRRQHCSSSTRHRGQTECTRSTHDVTKHGVHRGEDARCTHTHTPGARAHTHTHTHTHTRREHAQTDKCRQSFKSYLKY